MKHDVCIPLSAGLLILSLACRGGPTPEDASAAMMGPGAGDQRLPWTPATADDGDRRDDFTGFAPNAFPPTLPRDEDHADPWMRSDCLLCHEDGTRGAPVVQHVGMTRALLGARCRTCHVPEPEPGGETVRFMRNAFPPTLPRDEHHRGGWLRDDCLSCHEDGVHGARRVLHQGMSPALLRARCRSCHLPSESSEVADLPQEAR